MGYKYIGGRYAHRVIYERHIGPIPKGWVVHHRDEDKTNNDPSNLVAMPRGEHQRLHSTGRSGSDKQRLAASQTLASLRKPKPAACLYCGQGFVSCSAGEAGKFCSKDCTERWRNNRFVPEQRSCLVCGSEYMATKRFQRYCCKQCNNRSTVRTYRTEANGGTPRRTLAQLVDVQPDS
jgi:hypothetical protein